MNVVNAIFCCVKEAHELTCQILTNQSIKIGGKA